MSITNLIEVIKVTNYSLQFQASLAETDKRRVSQSTTLWHTEWFKLVTSAAQTFDGLISDILLQQQHQNTTNKTNYHITEQTNQ